VKEIKSVIFDWGGVLVENPGPGLMSYCADKLKVTKTEFENSFNKLLYDFQTNSISEASFWELISRDLDAEKPLVPSLWKEAFESVYKPRNEMFLLAGSLQKNGCKTAILSNTEIPATDFFIEQRYNCFDVQVFSCIEGTVKPHRKIFDITVEKLGCRLEQSVFIDDNPEFIKAAKEIGINAILFESTCQIRTKLTQFGLDCISCI
jgi:epoxide hydrolase-like predicted phosphatase